MKRLLCIIIATVITLSLSSCGETEPEGMDDGDNIFTPISLTTKQAGFVQTGNKFAMDLIAKVDSYAVAQKDDDWFISPLSLQIALGMLLNGAQGETAAELCKMLGYGESDVAELNKWCSLMLDQLPNIDKKTKLKLADAIFYNKRYTLKTPFRNTVGTWYDAELQALDFTKAKASADIINKWCDKQTEGMVPHVLDEVDAGAIAYLVNALYFKSQWTEKFSKGDTGSENFTTAKGSKKKVKMMKLDGKSFTYGETDRTQAVSLPYGNGAYSMTVILPKNGYNVHDIAASLGTPGTYTLGYRTEVDLWLPRFETKYHIVLNDVLQSLGMKLSFAPGKADFKAMCDQASHVDFVQQDTAIKVDEEGSEAAAVTVIGVNGAAAIIFEPQKATFHADHPFIYLIQEKSTGVTLFAGIYTGDGK
ncbi:MAG: serpin family protein [Bacteroidales bacterium]|nr:serpin family protein [Bacteroidales bacterium]